MTEQWGAVVSARAGSGLSIRRMLQIAVSDSFFACRDVRRRIIASTGRGKHDGASGVGQVDSRRLSGTLFFRPTPYLVRDQGLADVAAGPASFLNPIGDQRMPDEVELAARSLDRIVEAVVEAECARILDRGAIGFEHRDLAVTDNPVESQSEFIALETQL